MDQLWLVHWSVVVRSLNSLNLPLEFRCTARVDRRDLLISNQHGLTIDAFSETYAMLASAHAAMTCLGAYTIEQICIAISLRFCTLIAHPVTLTRALTR